MKRMPAPRFFETKIFENINEFSVSCNLVRQKFSIHQHEYYELELILDGQAVHSVNGESTHLSEGDVVFVTPMDRHGFEDCLFRTITIHFSAQYLSDVFRNALASSKNRIIRKAGATAKSYFDTCHRVFMDEKEKNKAVKIRNLVELILLELMPDILESDINPSYGNDRLSEAIGFINVSFTNELTLSVIESKYGLSPSYFSRAFKKRVGKSFVSYITEKRIEYAKKLLVSGERIIDTCYECGFNSERNFARRFRQMTGLSPNEYQKMHKGTCFDE